MSHFDIAAGATPAGLRGLLNQLYGAPQARAYLFKGEETIDLDMVGQATGTWDVAKPPVLRLEPPTQAQWNAAHFADPEAPTPPRPAKNAFAIDFPQLDVSLTAAGLNKSASGLVTAYGYFTLDISTVSLRILALGIDESSFSMLDEVIVNRVVVPQVLEMAQKVGAAIPLPHLPSVAGITFQEPSIAASPAGLAIAASRSDQPAPDAIGLTFPKPGPDLFALVNLAALDEVIAGQVKGSHSAEEKSGSDAFTTAARVTASDLSINLTAGGAGLQINISGKFSAYGELSGTGVGVTKTVLCPVGAAADAIANPNNWDKVISEVTLIYQPDPLPVLLTTHIGPPGGSPLAQVVQFAVPGASLPANLQLFFTPKWSGSVTGTALAAAASAFTDVVSLAFRQTINAIAADLVDHFAKMSFALPTSAMTTEVPLSNNARLSLALSAPAGPVFAPISSTLLCQPLRLSIS